jgi:uncharacterized protein
MKRSPHIGLVFLCVALAAVAPALNAQEVPFLQGRVNDYADILSPNTKSELERELKAFEDSTSNQVAILTINSLDGANLEEYSVNVAQTWKLGQKGKDNGVLLLVVKDDRKMRIEVGYGLEGTLTDALCSTIIQREILPRFRKGDYNSGVKAGIDAIVESISGTFVAEEESGIGMEFPEIVIFLGIFGVVVGVFTFIAVFTKGFMSWFLYVFLIPFWMAFPYAAIGGTIGLLPFAIYALAFPIVKMWLAKSSTGIRWQKAVETSMPLASSSSGGWSSSGGGWSSSSSGFSGGGGSFGGGGSSGSW